MPAQPAGGFAVVPPAPDRQDAARRMKLDGAADEVKRLSGDADKTLGGMMPGGSAPLPAPAISGEGDLKELQQVQRQIQLYNSKNTLAEIVVKYWGTVFNNEHAKAWREEERKQADAEAERAKKAAAEEAERAKAAAQTAATQLLASGGAGASVEAPLPRVYEILGAEAGLIVHGAGLTYAHAGQTLGNGDKVVAVSGAGVVIERDGKKLSLGFATGR
jgi:biotin carboxyl carrier protein